MITLKLYDKPEIETTTIDGKRHYLTPDGVFPSVTTVLSNKLDKSGLEAWRKKVGEEEANKISTQAANRGTAIHDMAEKYILGEDYRKGQMPVNLFTFGPIRSVLDNRVTDVYGIEYPLWSRELNTAGRTDLIADFDGSPSIVDFKTSRKLKEERYIESYFLQATCYSLMANERLGMDIKQLAIIIAVDHEDPQVFVRKTSQYIDKVRELFTS
jgi:genome maintenance exonuclease 1